MTEKFSTQTPEITKSPLEQEVDQEILKLENNVASLAKDIEDFGGEEKIQEEIKSNFIFANNFMKNANAFLENTNVVEKWQNFKNESAHTVKVLALLSLLGVSLTSCKKAESGITNSVVVKPKILNTLGKMNFDNPNPLKGRDKVYIWYGTLAAYGNPNGSTTQTRMPYYDYDKSIVSYGGKEVNKEYADSIVNASNGITPNEVLDVVTTLQTKYPLTQEQKNKYKYIIKIKVYPSTQYDFNSDANGIETSSDWGSGYAVYLTNLETIKDKDLYPTMLELIIKDKNSVSATGEWMVNRGDFLLKSEPDIQ